ncbi:hypothetical protein HY251_09745, partial [bacterium]|nr:hypothetical protein [bacterium]
MSLLKWRTWTARARGAAVLGAIMAFSGPPARAQDEDPEAKRLREAAEKEAEADKKKEGDKQKPEKPTGDEAADLRAAAAKAASEEEDRGVLGRALNQLVERGNEFNPRMVVSGDFVGRLATNHNKTVFADTGLSPDDRMSLREAELDLRAAIDPYANGVVIISVFEQDGGGYGVDVEEGYFTLDALPYQLKLQLGRFRVPFGRLNALHTHDLPQTTRPYALQDIFGEDGWNETGGILSWLAPGPIPITLSAIILNGENPRILSSSRTNRPAYMGRGEIFFQINDVTWASLGASYLFGYSDVRGPIRHPHDSLQETQLAEADLTVKWQPDTRHSIVFVAEVYQTIKHDRLLPVVQATSPLDANGNPIPLILKEHDHGTGAYAMLQVQPLERWYFGVRGDWSNQDEARPGHRQWAGSIWAAFYTTEFLRFRVGFEHRERRVRGGFDNARDPSPNDTVFFEITWVFGSHPA